MKLGMAMVAALATLPALAFAQSAPAPAAPAASGGGLNDRMINNPLTTWNAYGPNQTSVVLDHDGPKGYPATRVTISAKGANAWDAGVVMPVPKAIPAGHVLYIAVYLRAPEAKPGETVAMPFIGMTSSGPPYVNVISDHAAITGQWAQYYALGRTTQAFPAGGTQATVHLAGAKQVIDVGPIRVFDLGSDFDTSRLPRNP